MKNKTITSITKKGLLGASLLFTPYLSAQDITSDLLIHYDFNNENEIINVAGNNDYNGRMFGVTFDDDAVSGKAVKFSDANSDYILLPDNINMELENYTISAWVKSENWLGWGRIFDFGENTSNYMFLTVSASGNNSDIRFAYKNGGSEMVINSTKTLPLNEWVNIAITMQYNNFGIGEGILYVNGEEVGRNSEINITPSMLGNTAQNYLGKSQWPDPSLNGLMDEFKLFTRALSPGDIMTLAGIPAELVTEYNFLDIGDMDYVTENLELPTILENGVTIEWTSSNPEIVDINGTVTRPDKYNMPVVLTAKLIYNDGAKEFFLERTFNLTVISMEEFEGIIGHWDFCTESLTNENGKRIVKDLSGNNFDAEIMNEAKIRTIGNNKFKVLDLGDNKGYLDLGEKLGEMIYTLDNYTIGAYFRVDEDYSEINSNGNFIWSFSNTQEAMSDARGYLIASLKNQGIDISSHRYDKGNQAVSYNQNADKGRWVHFAFSQNGNEGTIFIDGVRVASNTNMTNKPYNTLVKDGLNGTLYNWIGRSNYGQDVYLRNTLIYDFRIYNAGLGAGDIQDLFEVNNTLRNLDNAYYENPDYIDSALQDETDALTLDLPEFVTENIILPTTGTSNPDILISWISNRPTIVDEKGYVARPAMFDYPVKLTAVLSRDGQSLEKDFNFTVKAAEGTEFKDNLLVHFDFSPETVNGNKVTDRAEKNFTGTVMNEASIIKIGNDAEQFNVLSLGSNTGYFDMGEDMGAIIYNLKDFTMSAYFYIKDDYEHITSNGNFLWNFSNSDDVMTDLNGYVIGSVKDQAISIAKTNYKDQQSLAMNMNMNEEKGTWHHLAFTLEGNVMNLYYDGNIMDQNENFTYVPSDIVPVDGRMGTNFNWIGRSCYAADSYLKDTYVHDFRLYNKALDPDELAEDVDTMLNKLNEAVALGVNSQIVSDINLYSENGTIYILNHDNSSVYVFDILGRKVNVSNNSEIHTGKGIFIVKVNNSVVKVTVK